jgi:site-specific recombinase
MIIRIFFLKFRVIWRRFRRGANQEHSRDLQYGPQVASLMARAHPFACWDERANWMIDIAEWIRRQPKVSLLDERAWQRVKLQRVRFLLDWLAAHREMRRVVQATLQKTLREAVGPELFSATGLPREPGLFGELWEHFVKRMLPRPPAQLDLSMLFTSMFPEPADAEWLLALDRKTLSRIWKLCADDGITHNFRQQVDEALQYLVAMVVSVGISPAFRQRLEPRMSLQATPFMALRREIEAYLQARTLDEGALRSVRMLIAVCQAQTDRIYAHLDENGVSIDLVYHTERMRAQLTRMARLIDLRAGALTSGGEQEVQTLLIDLVAAHHRRSSVWQLGKRSVSLLARKIVERNADHGEQYLARDGAEYRAMLKAATIGGVVVAFTLLGKLFLSDAGLAQFFEGAFVSLNYVLSFLVISALGGVLASRQPAVTAPALAARMGALDAGDGLRVLLLEIAALFRSQAAAVFGNVLTVIPVMLLISYCALTWSGAPLMSTQKALASLQGLSIFGMTPLFAAFTGLLLWLASLAAGFADNWFALRRLREALTHHRRLIHALGASRAERLARWLERHVAGIAGNVALGILFGMTPVFAQFFGLPLDVRHVTLASATLGAAAGSLGWQIVAAPDFWLALAGIAVIALLNVGVSFACSLTLALGARDVPTRLRRLVFRGLLRRFMASPLAFLFPVNLDVVGHLGSDPARVLKSERKKKLRKTGSP